MWDGWGEEEGVSEIGGRCGECTNAGHKHNFAYSRLRLEINMHAHLFVGCVLSAGSEAIL